MASASDFSDSSASCAPSLALYSFIPRTLASMMSRPISAASPVSWAVRYSSVFIMASTASRMYCSLLFSSSAFHAPMALLASMTASPLSPESQSRCAVSPFMRPSL